MNKASDFNLNAMTRGWAVEIFERSDNLDTAINLAHEYADGTEWVIYHGKSHDLCQHCDTALGEEYLEDVGQTCEGMTYDKWASALAYAEIYQRLCQDITTLFDMIEAAE